jgi:hypothetical protein
MIPSNRMGQSRASSGLGNVAHPIAVPSDGVGLTLRCSPATESVFMLGASFHLFTV